MDDSSSVAGPTPLFSFVVAVYDVDPYLPAFLASVDHLNWSPDQLELIFVDDGSTDDSRAIVENWLAHGRYQARLLHQRNGGPGSARNRGLAEVRGRWVSFPDPDDMLSTEYLTVVASFVTGPRAGSAAMVAARPVRFTGDPRRVISPHVLDFKYADPERIVDLAASPEFVHLHTVTGFYRTERIRAAGLRFDEEVRPVFEDAAFNADYLLASPRPTIAFLGMASYYYRRRADESSLTGGAWRDPAMYSNVPDKGYLGLLERAPRPVPAWVQNLVFYDLQWFFKADARTKSDTAALTRDQIDTFHGLVRRIVEHLDEATLLQFHAVDIPVRVRLALLVAKTGRIPSQPAFAWKLDYAQQIVLLSYFTTDPRPTEQVRTNGRSVRPAFAKTTAIEFFQRPWLYVRDLWVPSLRPVTVDVAGRRLPIVYGPPAADTFETSPREVWRRYAHRVPPISPRHADEERVAGTGALHPPPRPVTGWRHPLASRLGRAAYWSIRLTGDEVLPRLTTQRTRATDGYAQAVRRRSAGARARGRYDRAWVLIDRDTSAWDNAEALYRYLRAEQPAVNAWFVVSRSSPDWTRLEAEGFRLLDFGSVQHALAMRNAEYLISSQADDYIVRPAPAAWFGPARWKLVFLQHGVIHTDLSRWLNRRPIRMMITTTRAEHDSIVGDTSPYVFGDKEVERTGLPRHDTLRAKAAALPPDARRHLLVAPTWRDHLLGPQGNGHRRELLPGLADTRYRQAWCDLLADPKLHRLAEDAGLPIVFLPHPHLAPYLDELGLPAEVRTAASTDDVQDLLARARVLITDYSSIAFDAAFLGTPVVYYQFDAEQFFSGRHTVRLGSYSYRQDGFGPVVEDADAALAAVGDLLSDQSPVLEVYRRRMRETFTFRDGRCSERVYQAIRRREIPFQAADEGI